MTHFSDLVTNRPNFSGNDWVPPEPPQLDGIAEVELDCETNGLDWWGKARPGGISIATPDGVTRYLPWAHKQGRNLDEEVVKRWAQRELRGKHITNLNIKFDIHMLRVWGVDLEAQSCTFADVGHFAALLDDHRQHFSQESIVADYLPIDENEAKVKEVGGVELDMTRAMEYPSHIMAVRAEADVRQVQKLKKKMWPMMTAEGLHKVRALEDALIPVVCEMEKNGALIDIHLLDIWLEDAERKLKAVLHELSQELGRKTQAALFEGGRAVDLFNPDSPNDMVRLFEHLHLPIAKTENDRPSFTAEVLKKIEHPTIKRVIYANRLTDLLVKYLRPYAANVNRSTGILRYSLNQLKQQKDPWSDRQAAGTVTGRFSSSALSLGRGRGYGINIQQILKTSKQRVSFGYDEDDASHDDEIFVIRRLHIAAPGAAFLSSDAMQIEYRLFASETGSQRLIDIYKEDALASFHKKTHAMLLPHKPNLTYRRQKDVNFANVYGAGQRKQALMLEFITKEEYFKLLKDPVWYASPLMKEMQEIAAIYNREIPEVKPLLARAQELAEERGYVKTILGRRSRFKPHHWIDITQMASETIELLAQYDGEAKRSHKALNSRIQGSAADIMKVKLVELHKERKSTGFLLRYTVHDEVDGDCCDGAETLRKVSTILNRQSFPSLSVPILWELGTGANWMEAGKDSNAYDQTAVLRSMGYKVNEK